MSNSPSNSDAPALVSEQHCGRRFRCACGREHHIRPDRLYYADDAVAQLPAICRAIGPLRRLAVLMDVRTRHVAGAASAEVLSAAGFDVAEIVVPDTDGATPVCDEATLEAVLERLHEPQLVVTVGSGVLTDLGKWAAWQCEAPFVAFATAASMNGYTSANVAPTLRGVKTLLRAHPPMAVLSSPATLGDAPYDMTAAGLGDLLAKPVSSADWRMNHLLFGDYYCQTSVDLVARLEPLYLNDPQAVRARRPHAIRAIFDALLLSGIAMTLAETSAPASGGEHLISHSLDMMSAIDGRPHDLHGRQVGVASVLTAELYRRVLAVESPHWIAAPQRIDATFWGPMADVVADHYAEKRTRLAQAARQLTHRENWDALRGELSAIVRGPEVAHECLARAGGACRADHLGLPRQRLAAAFTHSHEIRSRFTVLDLAYLTGVMPAAADEIVEQWA